MKIPWNHRRCILCLEPSALTTEHVIPRSLGGRLQASFLCKKCNSLLGHRSEAAAREDPTMRYAVENLAGKIPKLAEEIAERQWFVGNSKLGKVRGRLRRGRFRPQTKELPDGSMIHPTRDARRHLRLHLESIGTPPDRIADLLRTFDRAPEDVYLPIAPRITVVKWSVGSLVPASGGRRLHDSVLLKMAYEYAALHLDRRIYERQPPLDRIREAILNDDKIGAAYDVEYLSTRKYSPLHALGLEAPGPHSVVRICLFGWAVYRVHLHNLAIRGPRAIYEHRLDTKRETLYRAPNRAAR